MKENIMKLVKLGLGAVMLYSAGYCHAERKARESL